MNLGQVFLGHVQPGGEQHRPRTETQHYQAGRGSRGWLPLLLTPKTKTWTDGRRWTDACCPITRVVGMQLRKINIQHQKLQYFVLNLKNLFSGSSARRICALCELKVRGHLQLVMLALAGASESSSGGSSLSSPDARPRQRSTSHTSGWYREK